ncbi:MAG: DUF6279 family lipoprotein [Chromatiales bacterium]
MSQRALRWICLTALLLALTGCSRVQFVYGQLDWLVPFYLNTYVTLDDEQYAFLETEVARLLEWHCSAHLRDYAQLLREADSDFQQGRVTPERLISYTKRLERYWLEILQQALPSIAELLHRATDEQIDELFEVFEERNEEARERLTESTPDELLEDYQERMTEELERWFGAVTPDQAERVVAWSERFQPLGEEGIAFRKGWQARLRGLLEDRSDVARLQTRLEALFGQTDDLRPPAYRARLEHNRRVTVELIADVAGTLTPEQLAHMAERIEGLAGDFEELACEAEEQAGGDGP